MNNEAQAKGVAMKKNGREPCRLNLLVMRLIFFVAKRFFYDVDGGPKRCTKCGCREFGALVKESINGIAAEQDYICKDCGATVGFWAYGYFDPQFSRHGAA
jgi:hypothetical protein